MHSSLCSRFPLRPVLTSNMDSDKFGDPRTRSKVRGRGRGRGRGVAPATVRGRGRGRVRGRGRGSGESSRGGRGPGGRNVLDKLESNSYRFDEYDEMRASVRRDGVTEDVDMYTARMPGKYEEREDGGDEEEEDDEDENCIDVHVADGGDEGDMEITRQKIVEKMMVAEFTNVASVLAQAPLWARVGWRAGQNQLADLIEDDDGLLRSHQERTEKDQHCNSSPKEVDSGVDDEVNFIGTEIKELSTDEYRESSYNVNRDQEQRAAGKSSQTNKSEGDDFDRWLDEI